MPPPTPYPRAEMQAQVVARVEAGLTLDQVGAVPGCPSRYTLHRWARADAAFARQLKFAQAWARGVRRERKNQAELYDAARAEAFLLAVRRGAAVRDLVRRPEWPNRDGLNLWKRLRPDFAAELAAAARFARSMRPLAWPFDQAVADELVRRVFHGETLRDLAKDPGLPGRAAIRRWRRLRPDFDAALRSAWRPAFRRTMQTRGGCTDRLTAAIAAHIRRGGSLRSAARVVPGAPHRGTLYLWMQRKPDFSAAIEDANTQRDDLLLDQALMIAEAVTPASVAADAPRLAAIRRRVGQLSGGRRGRDG